MKILAIGDFHGKMPGKLKARIKKIDYNIVLCTGDLADTNRIRDLIFKNWNELKDKELEDIFPKTFVRQITVKAINSMQPLINWLYSLNKPVYLVYGNGDYPSSKTRKFKAKSLNSRLKKSRKIFLLTRKLVTISDFELLGFSGYKLFEVEKKKRNSKKEKNKIKKAKKEFEYLFKKVKIKKSLIVLFHDPPYNCKLDKITNKKSPRYGEHYGDKILKRAIKKYKPLLVICGHMHENQGKCKIRRTTVINPGAAYEGKAALIELENERIKNIKFFR